MKLKLGLILSALMLSYHASAAPSFKIYEVSVPLANQAAVLEATDEFMKSKKGKSYPGGLHVNTIMANGISPATHSFVMLMDSMKSIAEWESGLAGNADVEKFWAVLDEKTTPVSQYMGSLVKSWGNISNKDRIWQVSRLYTTDPVNTIAAMDKLFESVDREFPGQTAIHAIPFGSRNGANNAFSTHMLVNGYESVEELEEWTTYLNTQPALAEFFNSVRSTLTWQGTDLISNTVIYDDGMDVETFVGN